MLTQTDKGRAFRLLHQREGAFIIPNPWDVGSASLPAHLGFEALATTSMGYAFSAGQRDNTVDRAQVLASLSAIALATSLPVSADLENGFGHTPEIVAETIGLAAAAGAVGGSIEESSGAAERPIYEKEHASERESPAAGGGRSLPFSFSLTARRPGNEGTWHLYVCQRSS